VRKCSANPSSAAYHESGCGCVTADVIAMLQTSATKYTVYCHSKNATKHS